MKKLFVIILILASIVAWGQQAKKVKLATAAVIGTTAHAHYTQTVSWAAPYTMQWILTPAAASRTDSTVLIFEGSIDGTTWYKTNLPGEPVVTAGTNTSATYYACSSSLNMKATSTASTYVGASLFYTPSFYLTPPYFRATVTHYEPSGTTTQTTTVTGYLYVKP